VEDPLFQKISAGISRNADIAKGGVGRQRGRRDPKVSPG